MGEAEVVTDVTHPLLRGSDHRPVVGKAECPENNVDVYGWKNISRGWCPTTDEERRNYRRIVHKGMVEGSTVHNTHTIIMEAAEAVGHTTAATRRQAKEEASKEENGIAQLKRDIRMTPPRTTAMRDLKRQLNKAKKKDKKKQQMAFLKLAVEGRHPHAREPLYLTFNGEKTADKEGKWRPGTQRWEGKNMGTSKTAKRRKGTG